ncbi:MAG: Zn-ribbon domain-containing OB-fold protein, partial [bacterium]
IWSYAEHHYKPPAPYIADDPFVPYTIAAVELAEEKLVVLGQMAAGVKHAELKAGMQVELVVERIYDVDNVEHTIWKWKPIAV